MGESIDVPARWSGRPSAASVPVPVAVASLAEGRAMVPVWLNEAGGLTYEVGDGAERCFVKWAPAGSEPDLDLAAEADRMEWARQFHPVPRPLARGQDADGSWLVTAPVPGDSAVTDRWADLAIATWSAGWNYGPGWDGLLLDAYGVEPDPERTRYYRLLWDLD